MRRIGRIRYENRKTGVSELGLWEKSGATLVETMVTLFLISILTIMAASSLSATFRIFMKLQKTQQAQSVLSTTMTELRTLTQDATGYLKIYPDGGDCAGQAGTSTGTALEFMNQEGYVVLISAEGCEKTELYISGNHTGSIEAVDKGQLLLRYYFPNADRTYTMLKNGTAQARAVAKAYGKGFYMGNYLRVTFSLPEEASDTEQIASITATVTLYTDKDYTEELASDTEVISFRHPLGQVRAVTACSVSEP